MSRRSVTKHCAIGNPAGELWVVNYSDTTPDVTNSYDRRGRLTNILSGATSLTKSYNDANNPLRETYSGGPLDGLSVTSGYDALLRRTNLSILDASSTLLASIAYSYDDASRLLTVGDGTHSATYDYLDNSSLVEQIVFARNGTTVMTTTKGYDFVNRLTNTVSLGGTGSTLSQFDYRYNTASQRTSVTNLDGSYWVYGYDSMGQVTSGKKYWSDGTPVAGQQFDYAFDDIGNRQTTTRDGRQATYTPNSLNQYTSRTVPGGVGGLLAITDASQGSHFCAYDGNGNVMALLKADGTGLTAQYEYGPFGEVLRATGAMAKTNPFRFSTKYQDDQSDYLYYGYRYYNPNTGRWLSRDPIGEAGGLNVYAFVVNDPLSFIDPLGDDFIAVSDRPVKGTLGLFYHYSVQYWISCDNPELNTEYDIEKWLKKNVAKKRESTELLADEGWKVWRLKGGTKWKLEDTKVSLIYYSDSGTKFAAIYKGTPQQVKQQWAKVIQQAKGYKYAEQPGFNGAFKNWPNSRYDVGDDVNNSNTYIRDIVKNSGMTMKELGGSHPGRNSPQPIPDDYGGQKPFKGPAPPQPPTPTPGP
jgi:RHS repeat-associated protein